MTNEELEAIEARIDAADPWAGEGVRPVLENDAPALVAEVRRLQAIVAAVTEYATACGHTDECPVHGDLAMVGEDGEPCECGTSHLMGLLGLCRHPGEHWHRGKGQDAIHFYCGACGKQITTEDDRRG